MTRPIQSFLEEFQLLPPPREPLREADGLRPLGEKRRGGGSSADEAWQRGYEAGRAEIQAQADAQMAEELEHARAQAFEQGRDEGARETREAVTAELAVAHEKALEAARIAFVTQESERLAAALRDGLADLRLRLAEKLARTLEPFLARALREKACAEMATMLERLFSGGDAGAQIRIEGPQDLLEALRAVLPDHPSLVMQVAPERPDIRISCADTTLETQIAQWSRIFSGDANQP